MIAVAAGAAAGDFSVFVFVLHAARNVIPINKNLKLFAIIYNF
jgi:hypothetical protein